MARSPDTGPSCGFLRCVRNVRQEGQDPDGSRFAIVLGPGSTLALGACSPDPSGELDPGERISVEVTNEGNSGHTFTIDALDLSTGTVAPGEVMTATFTVPEDATTFDCTFHGEITGTIVAT